MTRPLRRCLAVAMLLPVLLAGSACAPFGSEKSAAILERVADGDYDVGIRYPSKRTRYVMIVEEDEESFALTNRPANGRSTDGAAPASAAEPAMPQQNDRVLAPCAEAAGNWYRHTPAGYVCAGGAGG
ncbi:hypothetical protein J2848_002811 [Azospirillum lipoferum]|uniref:Lipoprotein n=1 Tax=Azospirillum lipoferum TaxID=193 RepID=A0A5A9GNZ4_AZOLI|nr:MULTISPECIES: hypothetical protein [Azospirillum]KAA0596178.1 hypothetical protein FZ942_13520 [Azospirillum lipoferum]MCP1611138.1 hypothetical protein [Azospirillum lipoferum]MDW5533737.1 hypothetical protein [Azospirillum sp. NL1]